MIRKIEYVSVLLSGGILYNLIELLWRGYTHWSMTIAGGMCMLIIHFINQNGRKMNLALRCLAAAASITFVEFCVGVVVNMIFKLDVWDYSGLPGNILGQVCPLFMFFWFLLSVPACFYSRLVRMFFDAIELYERQLV